MWLRSVARSVSSGNRCIGVFDTSGTGQRRIAWASPDAASHRPSGENASEVDGALLPEEQVRRTTADTRHPYRSVRVASGHDRAGRVEGDGVNRGAVRKHLARTAIEVEAKRLSGPLLALVLISSERHRRVAIRRQHELRNRPRDEDACHAARENRAR